MPPTHDFGDEEMEQEMIEAVMRAEASIRREQLRKLAEKKKQIEQEEQDLLKEVQKLEMRERRVKEAAKQSQEARRKAREEEDDWLLQALAFEQSRAEEQQEEGAEDSPPPSGIQPPSLQVKTPPGEEPWLEQGGADPVTITDVESRKQPDKKEQAAVILDKDKKGAREQHDAALNVTENEWESSQKTEKEQQTLEPAPDRVLDTSHGQVEQQESSCSLQPSRARRDPKKKLEMKRKESRWLRMSSSRNLVSTDTQDQQEPEVFSARNIVKNTALMFQTSASPLKMPTTHPASSRRGVAHSVCHIVRPSIDSYQPTRCSPTQSANQTRDRK